MTELQVNPEGSAVEAIANLVREAKNGDIEAFQGLYDRYAKRLLNFAFKMLGNREEAEDITQEAFIAVFRKLKSLKDDSKFEAWIFRIARNFIYQRYRLRAFEHGSLETDEELSAELNKLEAPEKSPEERLLSDELQDVVNRLIRELPEKYRDVFVLSAINGFSYQDIAEILGRSIPAVKTDIHRARLEVRSKIKHFLGTVSYYDEL